MPRSPTVDRGLRSLLVARRRSSWRLFGGAAPADRAVPAPGDRRRPRRHRRHPGRPSPPAHGQLRGARQRPARPSRSATSRRPRRLAVEGGDPVAGQLGSYTWDGGGSDSPWLPGAPIAVGAGERLTPSLAAGVAVDDLVCARAGRPGSSDGAGAVALGDRDGGADRLRAPPATGRWSVQVTVRFADELGSATYYWQVTVR